MAALEDRGLTFVSVDAPGVSGLPRLFALTTPDLFVVRFQAARTARGRAARESHLLMNNCYRDYGVRNAAQLRELLSGA